jgi:hypothetical protein
MLGVGCNGKMTLQTFISRLNWRLVLLHLVAFWFFIYAFKTFSYLYDIKLLDAFRYSKGDLTSKEFVEKGFEASDLTYFMLWTSVSGFIGLLVGFIISVTLSIKRHWFWINSLLAFIAMYLLYRFDLLGWTYFKKLFGYLGQKLNNSTAEFLLNGCILLTIGILLLFLKGPTKFIESTKFESV